MEAEAKPFIEHYQLQLQKDFFPPQVPFLAYSGMHGDDTKVTCITNGKDVVYEMVGSAVERGSMKQHISRTNERKDGRRDRGHAGDCHKDSQYQTMDYWERKLCKNLEKTGF